MSLSSAGIKICEPSHLYNTLVRCDSVRSVLDPNYLVLLDVRDRFDYEESHCLLAKHVKKNSDGTFKIPFGVDMTVTVNCIVYDGNTVSVIENSPAVTLANQIASNGSRNTVLVVKGGYERFSAEYPFLRTQKTMYTPTELEHLPHYPTEILPLFLYLGNRRHAYNRAVNHDMKIHAHVNMAAELYTAFPECISELHVPVEDKPDTDLSNWFDKICEFIETCRLKSERVLVFGELGISRSAVAIMAYLIKYKKWTTKEALLYVKQCRPAVKPLKPFIKQLEQWAGEQ